ncbi:MAG: hypothetical protein NZ825_06580 [Candidatus Marinimicrobia bacterium]|nr:hypothetical protein [Candidatus Neomarinimicrobiota bacterium]
MEGLAYWLFIAALYFLSFLMKKRKQKGARKRLDQEETASDNSDFIETEPETMDDFFDQLKNYGKEFLVEDESDVGDIRYDIEEEKEHVDSKIDIESKETSRAIFDDLSEGTIEPIHKEYRIHNKQNQNISFLVSSLLEDNNKVKKAIILKEIFDKPRGLRRSIR